MEIHHQWETLRLVYNQRVAMLVPILPFDSIAILASIILLHGDPSIIVANAMEVQISLLVLDKPRYW